MKWLIAIASAAIAVYALVDAYQDSKAKAAAAPLVPAGGASS